jgi:16S rRNA (uracil1498-N3)-methyltransferase
MNSMKVHRFIGPFDLSKSQVNIEDADHVNQIRNVLRLEAGEHLILSDGVGSEVEVSITSLSPQEISCRVEKIVPLNEPERKVTLCLAILKKENLEIAVQKAVEAGASAIVPVITERTIKTGLNTTRLEKIIKEATEQCGRSLIPKLFHITPFADALKNPADEKIIFHPLGENYSPDKNAKNISILVGPEGGFTEKELALAEEAGYKKSSLSQLIFRAETAATIATYRAVDGI